LKNKGKSSKEMEGRKQSIKYAKGEKKGNKKWGENNKKRGKQGQT